MYGYFGKILCSEGEEVIKHKKVLLKILRKYENNRNLRLNPGSGCGVDVLLDIEYFPSQRWIVIDIRGYFLISMTYGCWCSSSEFFANCGKRTVGFLTNEIHRDLSGKRCHLVSFTTLEIRRGELKAVYDRF